MMRRKIGVCTWIFGNIEPVNLADMIHEMGFDGVELYIDIDCFSPQYIKQIFADRGLEIFSITPSNVNLASSSTNNRKNAIAYYKKLIDYGSELGEPIIICHEYIQNQLGAVDSGSIEVLAESCQEIALYARQGNLKLGFEPLNRYLCSFILTSTDAQYLLGLINAANMTIVLDAFHMNLEEDDPVQAIGRCGDKLSIYQIADSNRKGIGLGHTNFTSHLDALDAINYNGPLILEPAGLRQRPGSSENLNLDEIKFHLYKSRNWLLGRTQALV
ncbi:MAG: sugar phosphate isomerase/epimerase family protein [Cyanobacteria bacterium J06639_18]